MWGKNEILWLWSEANRRSRDVLMGSFVSLLVSCLPLVNFNVEVRLLSHKMNTKGFPRDKWKISKGYFLRSGRNYSEYPCQSLHYKKEVKTSMDNQISGHSVAWEPNIWHLVKGGPVHRQLESRLKPQSPQKFSSFCLKCKTFLFFSTGQAIVTVRTKNRI